MNSPLPDGFSVRPAALTDLEILVDILNRYWEPILGIRKFGLESAQLILTAPGFELASSTCVVLAPHGNLAGCMMIMDLISPPVYPEAIGCVNPDFAGQGVGGYLLQWAEERAKMAIARVPDDFRVALRLKASQSHEPTHQLLNKQGFIPIRHSLFMVIDLDQSLQTPVWPKGFIMKNYHDLPEVKTIYHATHEIFMDHWDYLEMNEDDVISQWQHQVTNDKDFDPGLWFLLMDGNEIAALALCDPNMGEDREMGYISTFGVRRHWRRQGLAQQLLYHIFQEFKQRGFKQVGLGVDAQSLTGAVRLYEKAGMRVIRNVSTYEKELRSGKEYTSPPIEDGQE